MIFVPRLLGTKIVAQDNECSKYPYVNGVYSDIHITPSIWKEEISNKLLPSLNIRDYTNLS